MSRLFAFSLLMVLSCPAAFAQSGNAEDAPLESSETRTQDGRGTATSRRDPAPTGRKSDPTQSRNARTPQRWQGFLPGMFR